MPERLTGVVPPIVTPFDTHRNIDVESLRRLVDYQVGAGVSGLFALGSSGEAGFLNDAERTLVVETVVDQTAGRVPVLAGVIETSSKRVGDQISRVSAAGADYAVVTAPFYAITCNADIEAHYRTVHKNSELPIVAYDIPVAVHAKLSPELLVRLGQDGVIVAIKDSSGDQGQLRVLIQKNRAAGSPLKVFTGTEVVVDANLLMGVDGAVPGLANVAPKEYVEMMRLAHEGKWSQAARLQDKLAELFRIVECDSGLVGPARGIGAFKVALKRLGVIDFAEPSAPLTTISDVAAEVIDKIVVDHFGSIKEA